MLKSLLAGAVLGVVGVGTAQAAVVDVTYTAKILLGEDDAGTFFAAGTNLKDQSLTFTYGFDTAGVPPDSIGAGSLDYSGGTFFSETSPSPAKMATITINGKSVSFAGDFLGTLAEQSTAYLSYQYQSAWANAGPSIYSYVTAAAGALPATLLSGYSYTVQTGDDAFGAFDLGNGTAASFAPTFLQETVISAVPLPAGLPLFATAILALGLGGYGLKRQRDARARPA